MENQINIEVELKRLDEIVEKMESKETSLDENIKLYEEGTKIIANIQRALKDAETKIEKVIEIK